MLTKIARKDFLKKYPDFAQSSHYKNKHIYPVIFDSYILFVEAKSTIGLCNKVSKELTGLMKILGYEYLTFLGDSTTPWLFRDHDYKPVKLGLDYLVKNGISKSFNGAIQVDITGLPEFLKHLFWLVRCNGISMYVHFSDPGFNIMASICQYGNVHISTVYKNADATFNEALGKTGLHILTDSSCGGGRIYKRYTTYTNA